MAKSRLLLLTLAVIAFTGYATAFQETNKLLTVLDGVIVEGAHTSMCFKDLSGPRERVGKFVTDSIGIYDGLTILNQRVSTINTVASTIMLIPGINKLSAFALIPLTTGLTRTSRSISAVQTGTEPIINAMREWSGPLHAIPTDGGSPKQTIIAVMTNAAIGKQHVGNVATIITMVYCGDTRANFLGKMENTATGMDAIPNMVKDELKRSGIACDDVKHFLTTTNNKIDSEVTTTLSIAKATVDTFNSALDPLQVYLDEVNKVLDRQLCLSDVEELLKQVPDYQKPVKEAVEKVKETAETAVNEVKNFFRRRFGRKRRSVGDSKDPAKKEPVKEVMDVVVNTVESLTKEVKNFFNDNIGRKTSSAGESTDPAKKEPVKEVMDVVVNTVESLTKDVKNFFNDNIGRKTRSVGESTGERKKRNVCVTVRQVLDGSIAVDGGYTTVAEFLVREVFNKVMPKLPGVNSDLTKLASTLLPFKSDFDLKQKSGEMIPDQTALGTFIALDYQSTFWEQPNQSDVTTKQACPGETALVIPTGA